MFWQADKTVKKKSNICGRNSSALRQVYSLVLAGWIPEINFPDPGSENNSLSFVRETRLGPIFISGDNLWPQNHMMLSAGDPAAARQSVWDAISLSLSLRHFLSPCVSLSHSFSSFLTSHYFRDCMKITEVWQGAEPYVTLFFFFSTRRYSKLLIFSLDLCLDFEKICNTLLLHVKITQQHWIELIITTKKRHKRLHQF